MYIHVTMQAPAVQLPISRSNSLNEWRIVMKIAANSKSFALLVLFSMAGAHAALASGPVSDAQEQARSLLGGRNFSASGVASRSAVESSAASASSAVDAQQQGRQMILGRPWSRVSSSDVTANSSAGVTADVPHTKTASGNRAVREGGDVLARRMILRTAY